MNGSFRVTRRRRLFEREESESFDDVVEEVAPAAKRRKPRPEALKIPKPCAKKPSTPLSPLSTCKGAMTPLSPCQRTTLSTAWENHDLPCREQEISKISDFLRGALVADGPGCLYISGVPGTGKTACVNLILSSMKEAKDAKVLKVNAFQFSQQPSRIYNVLAERLLPKVKSTMSSACCSQLSKFMASSGQRIILVLDEIDQLVTADSNVLYQIFEWALLPESRLVLIAIANTLSFTSTDLKRLQLKDCAPEQLYFAPYSSEQLATILRSRVEAACEGDVMMSSEAIELCARRIAAVTGDVRKALDVCRHAVEQISTPTTPNGHFRSPLRNRENRSVVNVGGLVCSVPDTPRRVTVGQVSRVLCQLYGSRLMSSSSSASTPGDTGSDCAVPLKQKALLCTMLLMKKKKSTVVTVAQLEDAFRFVCRHLKWDTEEDVLSLAESLDNQGMVVTKRNSKNPRLSKIVLQFSDSEVERYASDKALLSSITSLTLPKKS